MRLKSTDLDPETQASFGRFVEQLDVSARANKPKTEIPPEEARPTIKDRRQLDLVTAIERSKRLKPRDS